MPNVLVTEICTDLCRDPSPGVEYPGSLTYPDAKETRRRAHVGA